MSEYYGPNWDSIRERTIEEDGGQCVICFSNDELVVHHRKPIKMFDSHEEANKSENLATLCKRCHRRVESIQNPNTRRGLEHFLEELSCEDVEVPSDFIKFLCYNQPKSDAPNASCCSAEDCFYPVKFSDWACPRCGRSSGRLDRIGNSPESDEKNKDKYKCTKCGDISEFSRKPLNQHGCRAPGGHHNYELLEKGSGNKANLAFECPVCSQGVKSKAQLVSHITGTHEMGRIEAKKKIRSNEGVSDD